MTCHQRLSAARIAEIRLYGTVDGNLASGAMCGQLLSHIDAIEAELAKAKGEAAGFGQSFMGEEWSDLRRRFRTLVAAQEVAGDVDLASALSYLETGKLPERIELKAVAAAVDQGPPPPDAPYEPRPSRYDDHITVHAAPSPQRDPKIQCRDSNCDICAAAVSFVPTVNGSPTPSPTTACANVTFLPGTTTFTTDRSGFSLTEDQLRALSFARNDTPPASLVAHAAAMKAASCDPVEYPYCVCGHRKQAHRPDDSECTVEMCRCIRYSVPGVRPPLAKCGLKNVSETPFEPPREMMRVCACGHRRAAHFPFECAFIGCECNKFVAPLAQTDPPAAPDCAVPEGTYPPASPCGKGPGVGKAR